MRIKSVSNVMLRAHVKHLKVSAIIAVVGEIICQAPTTAPDLGTRFMHKPEQC